MSEQPKQPSGPTFRVNVDDLAAERVHASYRPSSNLGLPVCSASPSVPIGQIKPGKSIWFLFSFYWPPKEF